jgi:hypothetical protein
VTGYSPALAALAPLRAIDLIERLVTERPLVSPETVIVMSRDTLISALLPPQDGLMRHADHDPAIVCRPAGRGLCEPLRPRRRRVQHPMGVSHGQ